MQTIDLSTPLSEAEKQELKKISVNNFKTSLNNLAELESDYALQIHGMEFLGLAVENLIKHSRGNIKCFVGGELLQVLEDNVSIIDAIEKFVRKRGVISFQLVYENLPEEESRFWQKLKFLHRTDRWRTTYYLLRNDYFKSKGTNPFYFFMNESGMLVVAGLGGEMENWCIFRNKKTKKYSFFVEPLKYLFEKPEGTQEVVEKGFQKMINNSALIETVRR